MSSVDDIIWNGEYKSVTVGANAVLDLGSRPVFSNFCSLEVTDGAMLKLGDNVFFNEHCSVRVHASVEIGDNAIFGDGVRIFDFNHRYNAYHVSPSSFKTSKVAIGSKCWIGANTVILPGTTIGSNVIIGAGCVIHGVIPDDVIIKNNGSVICENRISNKKHISIFTMSDQIERLEELLLGLPDYDFHVACPSYASDYLKSFCRYKNFQLYENVEEPYIGEILRKTEVYLDINHGPECFDILTYMTEHKVPILAFDNTCHDVGKMTQKYSSDEWSNFVENVRAISDK